MGIFNYCTGKISHLTNGILHLDAAHKKIGGVCAGIASYLNVRPLYIRIAAVVILCIAPLATIAGYGLAYVILDDKDEPDAGAKGSDEA